MLLLLAALNTRTNILLLTCATFQLVGPSSQPAAFLQSERQIPTPLGNAPLCSTDVPVPANRLTCPPARPYTTSTKPRIASPRPSKLKAFQVLYTTPCLPEAHFLSTNVSSAAWRLRNPAALPVLKTTACPTRHSCVAFTCLLAVALSSPRSVHPPTGLLLAFRTTSFGPNMLAQLPLNVCLAHFQFTHGTRHVPPSSATRCEPLWVLFFQQTY